MNLSPLEKLRVRKDDFMITKLSKNNSNKSKSEYPHSTIPSLNVLWTFPWNVRKVPSERSRNVPRTKKMSGFFERSKAMFSECSCGMFQERSKGILRERSAAIFREYSKRTFLEPSIGTFREHLYRTFVEIFVGTFREHSRSTF